MNNLPKVLTTCEGFAWEPGRAYPHCNDIPREQEDNCSNMRMTVRVTVTEPDELFGSALMALLRRRLPALVEECEREAHDRVFPGDRAAAQEGVA